MHTLIGLKVVIIMVAHNFVHVSQTFFFFTILPFATRIEIHLPELVLWVRWFHMEYVNEKLNEMRV